MSKLYIFVCDQCDCEDMILFDNETDAKNYLQKQIKLYPNNNSNFRIEIFEKNLENQYLPTYNKLLI
jgi:hypothetical protein